MDQKNPSPEFHRPGYWGRPYVKEPVWSWQIPLYFFVGGLGGAAALITLGSYFLGRNPELTRAAAWTAAAAAVLAPILLAADLGRPLRFIYMLRVFKWRSPMSVGSWLVANFGAHAIAALVLFEWMRAAGGPAAPTILRVLFILAVLGAGFWGAWMTSYTGALIAASVIPVWNHHRPVLPVHFVSSALGSAAGLLELVGFRLLPLHVLGFVASGTETLAGGVIEVRRNGVVDGALRQGVAGWAVRIGGVASGPVALLLRIFDLRLAAAAVFLAGALISRYGWVGAGRASARDPRAVLGQARVPRPSRLPSPRPLMPATESPTDGRG